MAKKLQDYIASLPAEEQAEITAQSQLLIKEEMGLRELRRALKLTQDQLAQEMGVAQPEISKIEQRTDTYVSTVRRFIEAMGGSLDLVARFPDSEPVRIMNFSEFDGDDDEDARTA